MPRLSRRRFCQLTAAGALAGVPPAILYTATRDAVRLGLIGAGGRGRQLASSIGWTKLRRRHGQIVAVCDVNRCRAEQVRDESCRAATIAEHYQQVLDRDDIEAVVIATPDHWHAAIALAALRARKAVYCEKPLTLTIDEGKLLVAAVRETGGVMQVGTQQRSDWRFRLACELVRNGRLGQMRRVEVSLPNGSLPPHAGGGPFRLSPVPDDLNWDLWLGQAPWAEFCKQRYDPFRWWFEYSGGLLTDWGAHHLDIVQRALGAEQAGPMAIDGRGELPHIENGYSTPRRFTADLRYADAVRVTLNAGGSENGILFEGDEGRIYVNRGRLSGKPVDDLRRRPLGPGAVRLDNETAYFGTPTHIHLLEFFDCIRDGKRPISDAESQHRSATACHLANISIRLGRPLRWNAAQERFIDDPAADAMLSRPRRAGYALADCCACVTAG
jgi:myo-inositol 2-dehydrogenase / D-chiro-inositol 1-dehydrogenase